MTVKRSGREAEPKPRGASRWLFWRREPNPPPVIEVEAVVAEIVATEIALPGSVVLTRGQPERFGLEGPETSQVAAPPATEAIVEPPGAPPPAREWNIWELERRAREQAGDAGQDQEWAALFMHLRQFANADGVLPMQFDGLVRESFSTLIQAA
jgi:hypothetical protein